MISKATSLTGRTGVKSPPRRCDRDRISEEHKHDFDEYMFVIEGRCTVIIGDNRTDFNAGQEFLVPKGTPQRMEVAAGTRTLHVFGGKRAHREPQFPRPEG